MALGCSTNADCLPLLYQAYNSSIRNWCVQAVDCDPHYLQCVTWGRCATIWTQAGCLAGETEKSTQCVNYLREFSSSTDGSTTATVTSWATTQTAAVLIPLILLSILVFGLLLVVLAVLVPQCRCSARRGKNDRDEWTHVPMVTLDANVADEQGGEEDTEHQAMVTENMYNQQAIVL